MARPRKVHEERRFLDLAGAVVPLRIITERGRNNVRASVATRAVIFRLPYTGDTAEREKWIGELMQWVERTAAEKPDAFVRFRLPEPSTAYHFDFRGERIEIDVAYDRFGRHRLKALTPTHLRAEISLNDRRPEPLVVLPKLLSRHLVRRELPNVRRRVHGLNELHFQQQINAVKMSDTLTRWGSCSGRGNINLAARLLLAPSAVFDAVIIHELAHLIEANHGPNFWKLVKQACPAYKRHDAWLDAEGRKLNFNPVPVES